MDPGLLERAVDTALSLGASYAEARFHGFKGFQFSSINGDIVGIGRVAWEGVAVRVIAGGGMGFASTGSLDWESIKGAVERAVAAARAAGRGRREPVRLSEERLGRASYRVAEKRPLSSVPDEDKPGFILELAGVEPGEYRGMKVSSVSIHYSDGVEHKVIVNSDGAFVESWTPRVMAFYNIAGSSGERSGNKWGEVGGVGGLEVLEDQGFAEALKRDLEGLRVSLVEARGPPKGVIDVILHPEIVGLSLHESIGHPSEADRVLGREAAQAGLSYRIDLKGRIGSEVVTVIDDPTIPGSSGFYLYDDEGVPARPRVLIDRGELAELLHNRETAAVFGVKSNAAARALDYASEPIVRMANTYLAPGDYSFEELVEDVKEGVYMKSYMEWNIDEYRSVARYVGLEAYRIEKGEIKEPVTGVVLEISTVDYYSKIDAVGRDLKFYAGMCGKGEPMQPLPVWFGGPHIRLRGVRVG